MQAPLKSFLPSSLIKTLLAVFLLSSSVAATAAESITSNNIDAPYYSWVQLGAQGVQAKALVTGFQCPDVVVDDQTIAMKVRVRANPTYPLTTCEATLPNTAKKISIAGETLPTPNLDPQRIVIFGDTGCRITTRRGDIQDCNNPTRWPFAQVAAQVAKAEPDLVIHVGDYYYREMACPAGNEGCKGSPHGNNWVTWETDFFKPATPLLKAAPWVMLRGNHELCAVGGPGWFRMLDTHPYTSTCHEYSNPYWVKLTSFNLFVVDNANIDMKQTSVNNKQLFSNYLKPLNQAEAANTWLLMHRPAWVVDHPESEEIDPNDPAINTTRAEASWIKTLPATVQLIFSGHYHAFETLSFESDRPGQVIVGTGGALLEERPLEGDVSGMEVAGQKIDKGKVVPEFGYFVLDKTSTGWKGKLFNPYGQKLASCQIEKNQVSCRY